MEEAGQRRPAPQAGGAVVNSFIKGLRNGLPIGLGYLSVSFTFGIMAVSQGIPVWAAVLISMTNLTSAGQFQGLEVIAAGGGLAEMALTQLVINLRYALMSLSLSQKFDRRVGLADRLGIAFFNTDEIFAVASSQIDPIGRRFCYGLAAAPYVGWAGGTALGALAGSLLPASVRSALGIAIYGMFLAIFIPPAKKSRAVLAVVLTAVGLSCVFQWAPFFRRLSGGFAVILCTVAAAALGAVLFPVGSGPEGSSAEALAEASAQAGTGDDADGGRAEEGGKAS